MREPLEIEIMVYLSRSLIFISDILNYKKLIILISFNLLCIVGASFVGGASKWQLECSQRKMYYTFTSSANNELKSY